MQQLNLEYIEACQECGCLFHIRLATRNNGLKKDLKVAICPACKHEYELPKNI
jgi:hypothetical protein